MFYPAHHISHEESISTTNWASRLNSLHGEKEKHTTALGPKGLRVISFSGKLLMIPSSNDIGFDQHYL
ncbi:hypothetical protein P3S67_005275 [Capsicum chacoense]